jgi:cytochrome d ubiquinol oxidase subunit I
VEAPAVGASLLAFIVVYTVVFGIGIYYVLRLMRQAPATVPVPGTEAGEAPGLGFTGIGRHSSQRQGGSRPKAAPTAGGRFPGGGRGREER